MSDHTPGPWEVRELDGLFAIAHKGGWVMESGDEQQDRTDAKLIAAAPEMLQVIERLATPGWFGESELQALIQECRRIMNTFEG